MGQKKQDQKWPFFIAYCIVNCYFTLKVKDLKSVDIIFISAKIGLIFGLQALACCPLFSC